MQQQHRIAQCLPCDYVKTCFVLCVCCSITSKNSLDEVIPIYHLIKEVKGKAISEIQLVLLNRATIDCIVDISTFLVATDSQQDVPVILVGNKCDEEENRQVKTGVARRVLTHQSRERDYSCMSRNACFFIAELAQDYVSKVFKKCGFIETSAKTNHNVQEAFQVTN